MTWNADRVVEALRFAAERHGDQKFPGTPLPYLLHLGSVAVEALNAIQHEPADDDELTVLCAVLHDVIEDTPTTRQEVAARFGEAVAAGVDALSKRPGLAKPAAMADSLARIRQQPAAVWKVKLADRIANLAPPPHYWKRSRCERYRAEAEEILAALGEASPYLAARLQARIDRYPELYAGRG